MNSHGQIHVEIKPEDVPEEGVKEYPCIIDCISWSRRMADQIQEASITDYCDVILTGSLRTEVYGKPKRYRLVANVEDIKLIRGKAEYYTADEADTTEHMDMP